MISQGICEKWLLCVTVIISYGVSCMANRLQLDKLHSSPEEVTTFYGLRVQLKCAFKQGVAPVNITIHHNEKIVAHQENKLQLSITAGRWLDDYGLYSCVAEDDNNDVVWYNIKLTKINSRSIPTDGMHTTCARGEMRVKLSRMTYPWLQPEYFHMHLLDPSCGPYHVSNSHIVVKTAYGECGTSVQNLTYGSVFQNVFMAVLRARNGTIITRVPDVRFRFKCRFDGKSKTIIPVPFKRTIIYPPDLLPLLWGSSPTGLAHYAVYTSGSVVRARCNVGKYERFIGWEEDQGRFINRRESRVRVHGPELVINNVTARDGGEYKCSTDRRLILLDIFIVVELSAPRIQYILHGSDSIVACTAYGHPRPSIHWKKGRKLLRTKGRFTTRTDGSLRLESPSHSDSGNYDCIAEQYIKVRGGVRKTKNVSVRVIVYEPLRVDKSRSMPSIVKSYAGFDVRVMCTFHGGVPPLSITLTKRGKQLIRSVFVNGSSLYGTVRTSLGAAFGSYECTARDMNENIRKHKFSLIKAGPRDLTEEGVTVTCTDQYMDVHLSRLIYPWLDLTRHALHLVQSNCTPYNVTDMDVKIQAPLYGCGTTRVQKNNFVSEFRNMFIARIKPVGGSRITYLPNTYFLFHCTYEMFSSQGITVLQPIGPLTADTTNSSPVVIYAPKNPQVRLKCVFKGGVPPIRITLKRNDELISRVQGRNLNLLLLPWYKEAAGRYVCRAVDAKYAVAIHEITVNVAGRDVISRAGIAVHCGAHQTVITLDRTVFPSDDFYSIHLNDPICRPSHVNNTHVLFKIPPGSCGSRHITTSTKLVFSNRVLIFDKRKPGRGPLKKAIFHIPFQCKHRLVSSVIQKLR